MLPALAVLSVLAISGHARATASTYWFAFGDSYTKVQFDYTLKQPNDANPFGNPDLPGNTACGRNPNWIYWNAMKYNTTHVYAYDFAFGGATIDRKVVAPTRPEILTVVEQVGQFEDGYARAAPVNPAVPWTSANSLFSTFIGINDIGISYQKTVNQSKLNDALMDSYVAEMERLYAFGARNFLFLNVPPTDRSPSILKRGAADAAKCKAAINDYNLKLQQRIAAFQESHLEVSTWFVNTNEEIGKILDEPTKYGFRDATTYGSAPDLLWCEVNHTGRKGGDEFRQFNSLKNRRRNHKQSARRRRRAIVLGRSRDPRLARRLIGEVGTSEQKLRIAARDLLRGILGESVNSARQTSRMYDGRTVAVERIVPGARA